MKTETIEQIMERSNSGALHREAVLRDGYNAETRELNLAFASETPVERWYGREVLSCKADDVDMARLLNKAPLLMYHDGRQQIGVITSATVDADGVCRATVKLSRRESVKDLLQDIEDGILTKVSVGYELIEKAAESIDEKDETRTITWRWRPLEISLVSVPADDSVGIGREKQTLPEPQQSNETRQQPQEERMSDNAKTEAVKPAEVRVEASADNAAKAERERVSEILKLGRKHDATDEASDAIGEGTSVSDFRAKLLDAIVERSVKAPNANIGMTPKEVKRYSWSKAILSLDPNAKVDASFEREASAEVAKALGREPRGIFIPHDVQERSGTIGVSNALGTGGQLVGTDHLANEFIPLLRKKLAVMGAGARMLSGLRGNIAVPKQSASTTAYWVAENNAPTASRVTVTQVTGQPRTVGATTTLTRKLLLQSSPDIDALVREDLAAVLARGIDSAALHGAVANPQIGPVGITATSGVSEVAVGAGVTFAKVLEMLGSIYADNVDFASLRWLMGALVWEKLAGTVRHGTGTDKTILDPDSDRLIGRGYAMTNQVNEGTLLLGAFDQLILAMWGGLDLIADPYSESTKGNLVVTALQDVDVLVRYPEAFAFMDDVWTEASS